MDTAIHKTTNQHTSAFQITTGLEWKGKEREEFVAPYHEIGNWGELKRKGIEEVEVSFVKGHYRTRNEIKEWVNPHFRIKTDGAIENLENESEEHKLAKEYIYTKAINDEIILKIPSIGERKLSSFGKIKDIRIEKASGKKRADVLVKFEDTNNVYGSGIAFEVQISSQSSRETIKRNYDRASYGYSIVWIWSDDLINTPKSYDLIPYNEALEEYKNQIKDNINQELWDISKRTDVKVNEINTIIDSKLNSWRLKREQLKEDINSSIETLSKVYENINEDTKDKIEKRVIENIGKFDFSKISEIYFKDNLGDKLKDYISNKEEKINSKISESLNISIQNKLKEESVRKKIEEILKESLQNYESDLKTELFFKCDSSFNRIISDFKLKIQTELKNEFSITTKDYIQSMVKSEVKNLLSDELSKLKSETIEVYGKNKLSYYLTCPICNEEKHIMCFDISNDGKIKCIKCSEKEDGEENKQSKN